MSNLYIPVCAFFCSLLLIIVFFSKKNVKTKETKIFSVLLITSFIDTIIMVLIIYIGYVDADNIKLLVLLNRIDFIQYLVWAWMFYLYIYYITLNIKEKSLKGYNIVVRTTFIINLIILILILVLPVDIYNVNNVMYSYGLATNCLYVTCGLYLFLIIVTVLVNIKNIKNKKYVPVFALIFLAVILLIVRQFNPGLLLISAVLTYINLIMYFTIENPDLKLIKELNFARNQALEANNAKTDFLSSMSHEIRTPLNAIMGFSQALSEEDIPKSAKEEISDIVSASESLLEIVNGILDISKIEANKLEIINTEYDFNKILKELVSLTKARLGDKPLEVKVSFDPTIPPILYGDHLRLKQIILNLLTNSVKYTKEGYIKFEVSSIIKDDVCRLIISVEDSGIGIKKEKIDKLFTKFERLDADNTTIEGTGLGLAITKKLVELMRGNIVVQSVYGKGSKFTVAIDQKIVNKPYIEEKETTFEEFNAEGKKVLIVDDNVLNLKVAARLLQNYNVAITQVTSGFDCLVLINNHEYFDLILCDDMMPKMNGAETLKQLKKIEGFSIPVVMLTANAISGMREKYLNDGFDDYLSKPIQKIELNKIIKKFLKNNKL
ncbi:MAG: ATP-binding protein [Bacilli bacterium]